MFCSISFSLIFLVLISNSELTLLETDLEHDRIDNIERKMIILVFTISPFSIECFYCNK
ncbi:hypothetical protein BBU94A_0467 [Borreliella burgdorferi 94a]|uniref:Uncharacterized protein n=1 Tax=Borreliella burgdorferi 118a TaxID=476210 RepID=A0A7U8I7Q3_BORBG|nr:hypothetical protein BbuMM1_04480 [Borreliella burgdorferi]EEC21459.1 hypothetical protein Bbu156a_0413 [Borreliella burgdorferi 156a]EEG99269.1 hypothetical protein BBU118A_0470 [Borreliella burgdorferi 118a]EEH00199.1 hypothetical protein BBU94A_0467 [Borreliella burgdorferi 94a]EEH31713.1 hypothetical protein BBUBOL26_0467 [Borreliella burgdorferi Bol26]